MKPISTNFHGVLDYLSAGVLYALPRLLGWNQRTTRMMSAAATGTVLYSLVTRYELGVIKLLPMNAHLALDATSGALFCAAPFAFLDTEAEVRAALIGIGLFEMAVPLLTDAS